MSIATLRIATRASQLALWQANHVKNLLEQHHNRLSVELVKITTQGDKILDTPLTKIGGKNLFTKELEHALLSGEADIAVHSMKDVAAILPNGLYVNVILPRACPFDAWVSNKYACISECPKDVVIGTSSLRRACQIKRLLPNAQINMLRGNVDSRLKKLDDDQYDGIILAAAGLIRLGLENRIAQQFTQNQVLPAVGQGAIGIESRINDTKIQSLISPLNDITTSLCVTAERAMNQTLGGSCHTPIGGFATLTEQQLSMKGLVGSVEDGAILSADAATILTENPHQSAQVIGQNVAEKLLSQGAKKYL